jgi:hypothetical protein
MVLAGQKPGINVDETGARADRWRRPGGRDSKPRFRRADAASGGLAVVVLQQATEPFLAADRAFLAADPLVWCAEIPSDMKIAKPIDPI